MNNHLLKTHMRVSEGEGSQRELAICLHPHKDKLLFLDREYDGYFIDLAIISKFSFDSKFFYLKLGNKMLAFTRLPNGGTDEDYKGLIKELKNIKSEFKETDVCFASSYLDENKKSFGVVSERFLLDSGVVLEEKTEECVKVERPLKQPENTYREASKNGTKPNEQPLEKTDKSAQEDIDFTDSIASFVRNKEISDDLQKQIDALTGRLNKRNTYADETEAGRTVSNDGVVLTVKDIMNEVQHLADEQPQETLNKIPEGFHIVGEHTNNDVSEDLGATRAFDKQEFVEAVESEMKREDAQEHKIIEDDNDDEEKKSNLFQNIFIGLLVIVIIALLVAIGLMCTNNLDKVLSLFSFVSTLPNLLGC